VPKRRRSSDKPVPFTLAIIAAVSFIALVLIVAFVIVRYKRAWRMRTQPLPDRRTSRQAFTEMSTCCLAAATALKMFSQCAVSPRGVA
jgi:hypothetical protein